MTDTGTNTDKIAAALVLLSTLATIAFNGLAASGFVNGVTPAEISDNYPTPVTPAGYAFSIWSLIYVGLLAFSIYQLLPYTAARFRGIRWLVILTSVLNCAWIYFWHHNSIGICLLIISSLWAVLFLINQRLSETHSIGEYWLAHAPFAIYFGWVTAATLVNLAIFLKFLELGMSADTWRVLAVGLIFFAAALGAAVRYRFSNYLYPLAIAWALAAIGVKQSGQTLVVAAAAVGTVICLIASLSFVVNLPSTDTPRR